MTKILTPSGWKPLNEETDPRDTPAGRKADKDVERIVGSHTGPKLVTALTAAKEKHGETHFINAALNHQLNYHKTPAVRKLCDPDWKRDHRRGRRENGDDIVKRY